MSTDHHDHHPHATHAAHTEVAREAVHHATHHARAGSLPTAAEALAFVQWLGLTSEQIALCLAARDVPIAELSNEPKVNLVAIAAAYPPAVITAIEHAGDALKIREATPATIASTASSVGTAASAVAILRSRAAYVEHAARSDASVLDSATHDLIKQVQARSEADPTLARALKPVLAYHAARYPGSGGAKPPAAGAPPSGAAH